jgi:Mg2+/Co2+ transporter CorB
MVPDFSTLLKRPRSLTTTSSRSNFLILLRLGTLITNITLAFYGDWGSALQHI